MLDILDRKWDWLFREYYNYYGTTQKSEFREYAVKVRHHIKDTGIKAKVYFNTSRRWITITPETEDDRYMLLMTFGG